MNLKSSAISESSIRKCLRDYWRQLCRASERLWQKKERRKKKQDACAVARHVKEKFFAIVNGVHFGINLELLGMPVPGELTDSFQKLREDSGKELSGSVKAVLLASGLAAFFFTEEFYD